MRTGGPVAEIFRAMQRTWSAGWGKKAQQQVYEKTVRITVEETSDTGIPEA
jgi:hypothetical protein